MQDPDELAGEAPGAEQGGDGGSPPEGERTGKDPDRERLERENAQLREDARKLNAAALAGEFGLSEAQRDQLATLPRDKQRSFAETFGRPASATPPAAPAPAPATEPAPPASTEPENPQSLERLEQVGEPTAEQRLSLRDQMDRDIAAVPDSDPQAMQKIAEIQHRYKQATRSGG